MASHLTVVWLNVGRTCALEGAIPPFKQSTSADFAQSDARVSICRVEDVLQLAVITGFPV